MSAPLAVSSFRRSLSLSSLIFSRFFSSRSRSGSISSNFHANKSSKKPAITSMSSASLKPKTKPSASSASSPAPNPWSSTLPDTSAESPHDFADLYHSGLNILNVQLLPRLPLPERFLPSARYAESFSSTLLPSSLPYPIPSSLLSPFSAPVLLSEFRTFVGSFTSSVQSGHIPCLAEFTFLFSLFTRVTGSLTDQSTHLAASSMLATSLTAEESSELLRAFRSLTSLLYGLDQSLDILTFSLLVQFLYQNNYDWLCYRLIHHKYIEESKPFRLPQSYDSDVSADFFLRSALIECQYRSGQFTAELRERARQMVVEMAPLKRDAAVPESLQLTFCALLSLIHCSEVTADYWIPFKLTLRLDQIIVPEHRTAMINDSELLLIVLKLYSSHRLFSSAHQLMINVANTKVPSQSSSSIGSASSSSSSDPSSILSMISNLKPLLDWRHFAAVAYSPLDRKNPGSFATCRRLVDNFELLESEHKLFGGLDLPSSLSPQFYTNIMCKLGIMISSRSMNSQMDFNVYQAYKEFYGYLMGKLNSRYPAFEKEQDLDYLMAEALFHQRDPAEQTMPYIRALLMALKSRCGPEPLPFSLATMSLLTDTFRSREHHPQLFLEYLNLMKPLASSVSFISSHFIEKLSYTAIRVGCVDEFIAFLVDELPQLYEQYMSAVRAKPSQQAGLQLQMIERCGGNPDLALVEIERGDSQRLVSRQLLGFRCLVCSAACYYPSKAVAIWNRYVEFMKQHSKRLDTTITAFDMMIPLFPSYRAVLVQLKELLSVPGPKPKISDPILVLLVFRLLLEESDPQKIVQILSAFAVSCKEFDSFVTPQAWKFMVQVIFRRFVDPATKRIDFQHPEVKYINGAAVPSAFLKDNLTALLDHAVLDLYRRPFVFTNSGLMRVLGAYFEILGHSLHIHGKVPDFIASVDSEGRKWFSYTFKFGVWDWVKRVYTGKQRHPNNENKEKTSEIDSSSDSKHNEIYEKVVMSKQECFDIIAQRTREMLHAPADLPVSIQPIEPGIYRVRIPLSALEALVPAMIDATLSVACGSQTEVFSSKIPEFRLRQLSALNLPRSNSRKRTIISNTVPSEPKQQPQQAASETESILFTPPSKQS